MPKGVEVIDLTGDPQPNQRITRSKIDLTGDPPPNQRITRSKRAILEQATDIDVLERQARSKKRRRQQGAEADFDDLVIVQDTGVSVLKDFAHQRPQCGSHKFSESSCNSNAQFCSQCYCYVCDVLADECESWGDGRKQSDHCNAHRSSYWNSMKRAVRNGSITTPPSPPPPAATNGSGRYRMPDTGPLPNRRQQQQELDARPLRQHQQRRTQHQEHLQEQQRIAERREQERIAERIRELERVLEQQRYQRQQEERLLEQEERRQEQQRCQLQQQRYQVQQQRYQQQQRRHQQQQRYRQPNSPWAGAQHSQTAAAAAMNPSRMPAQHGPMLSAGYPGPMQQHMPAFSTAPSMLAGHMGPYAGFGLQLPGMSLHVHPYGRYPGF